MNTITCNDKDLPDDLQSIANEAARITIAAFESAAAHMGDPTKFALAANGALEAASLGLLKQRQAVKPRQVRALQLRSIAKLGNVSAPATPGVQSLLTHLRAQPSLVNRGMLAELKALKPAVGAIKLNAATVVAIKDAIASKDLEKMLDTMGLSYSVLPGATASASAAPVPSAGFTKLLLNIDRVRCLDDVGLELTDFFEDDIRLGGVGADLTTGQQRNVSGFKVGNFRTGESKRFSPRRKFVEFDLSRPGPWPRTFTTTFLMAESDGSGAFVEALRALWAAVHEVVEELVVAAVVAAAGGAGLAVGGPAGLIIGAVVGVAVGLIASYLFSTLEDDVFEPATVNVTVPDPRGFTPGQRKTGVRSENLVHPSASYTLKYEWELVQ